MPLKQISYYLHSKAIRPSLHFQAAHESTTQASRDAPELFMSQPVMTEGNINFIRVVLANIQGNVVIDWDAVATATGHKQKASATKQWSRVCQKFGFTLARTGGAINAKSSASASKRKISEADGDEDDMPAPAMAKKKQKPAPKNGFRAKSAKDEAEGDSDEDYSVKNEEVSG